MSKKTKKKYDLDNEPIVLDIPEDEIWTYQIEGLAAPHINKPYKNAKLKKVILSLVIIVAVSLSILFSLMALQKDTFTYEKLDDGTYQFSSFSNTGFITEVDIDYVCEVVYNKDNPDPETNFTIVKDKSKPITEIREYAFNCDEKVKVINIGASVTKIDAASFYSCWALQRIEVDENNPNYCDIDGVLYNKDMTEIICYPVDRDAYLCEKYGFTQYNEKNEWDELEPGEEGFEEYREKVLTYVLPSTVTKLGAFSMNYAYIADLYMPEGITRIETLALFKATRLENIYSYKSDATVVDTGYTAVATLGTIYKSLPEGLTYIGSDALSYNQALTYIYVPESVTYIGHHAFWDTVYKEDGELRGVAKIEVARSETEFEKVETGDQWKPQYDYLLFKKSVDVIYGAERAE